MSATVPTSSVVIGRIVTRIVTLPLMVRVGGMVAKGLGGVELCGPRTVEMDADELNVSSLGGGWEAGTVRVGDTVRRQSGPGQARSRPLLTRAKYAVGAARSAARTAPPSALAPALTLAEPDSAVPAIDASRNVCGRTIGPCAAVRRRVSGRAWLAGSNADRVFGTDVACRGTC
jgi:hypothetical protein